MQQAGSFTAEGSGGTTNKGGRRHHCITRHAVHLCDNSTQHEVHSVGNVYTSSSSDRMSSCKEV
jgi:hypothetical protein